MNKKGQAAMEFLMTYGWAIMVVLIVIGALAYFGVLNPTNLLPEKCFLPIGLACEDHQVTTNSAQLEIRNSMGASISIRPSTTVTIDDGGNKCILVEKGQTSLTTTPVSISNGDKGILYFSCSRDTSATNPVDLVAGEKKKFDININYIKGSGSIEHPLSGDLLTTVTASSPATS